MEPIFFDARVVYKVATEAEWNDITLDTLIKGEFYFYVAEDDPNTVINIKVGDGVRQPKDLPYMWDASIRVPFFGSATPSSTPTPSTGSGFWIATEAGTYTNYGGVELPANSFGIITRVGTTYGILVATIDLSGYVSTSMINQPSGVAGLDENGDIPNYAKTIEVEGVKLQVDDNYASISNITKSGNQKYDKSNYQQSLSVLTGGNLQTNSVYAMGYARVNPNTQYMLEGINTLYVGNEYSANIDPTDLNTFNSSNKTASIGTNIGQKTSIVFTTSPNTYWIAFNITNGSAWSLRDTAFLHLGSESLPYEPYTNGLVDPEKISGGVVSPDELEPISQTATTSLNLSNASISVINKAFDIYSIYNGTSYTDIQPYTLDIVGDYIEIKFRRTVAGSDNVAQNLYMLGTRGTTNNNIFGTYGTAQVRLRDNGVSTPYKIFTIPEGGLLSGFNTLKLQVISSGWEVVLNGISIGTSTKEFPFLVSNIGYAGTSYMSKMDVEYVEIKTGSQVSRMNIFGAYVTSLNVTDVVNPKTESNLPNVLFSLNLTGYTSGDSPQPLFMVYTKVRGNEYVGYKLARYTLDSKFVDIYRVVGADTYTFDGVNMSSALVPVLSNGESEAVWSSPGKSDLTGGWHGDEKIINVSFLKDGIPISISSNIPITACDSFGYIQNSNMYETDNSSHPIICLHTKITQFTANGYNHKSTFTPQSIFNIDRMYMGLFSISASFTNYAQNQVGEIRTLNHDSGNAENNFLTIGGGARLMRYWNNSGFSIECSSRMDNSTYDIQGLIFTKDNQIQSKYYRDAATTTITTQSGVIISGESDFRVFKN